MHDVQNTPNIVSNVSRMRFIRLHISTKLRLAFSLLTRLDNLDRVRRGGLLRLAEDVNVPEGRVGSLDVIPPALSAPEVTQLLVVLVRQLDLLEVRLDACYGRTSQRKYVQSFEERLQGVTLFGMTE